MSTITERIAAFTSTLTPANIPAPVREKCKVSLLHNIGVGLAGGPLLAAPRYAEALQEQGPHLRARLLLGGRAVSADTAAFVNAALMHARAQDDVYFPGLTHVGAILSPAVLAVAEELDLSGEQVVTALVAGYEAAGAISQGFAKRSTVRGFRGSGLYGGFAAAAGVASLLRLDAAGTAHALGLAASMASGTNQTWISGSQEWQFQIGQASRNGLLAARLAAAGGQASPVSLDGEAGFYRAFVGDLDGVDTVGRDLGQHWRSLEVTYKPYAVCAILQAPVRQAMELSRQHDLTAGDVAAVRLHLNPAEASYPGTDQTGPFAGIGATLMSAPFCVSVALTQRSIKGSDLKRLADPLLMPVIGRVQVVPDPALGVRQFVLEVDLHDGRRLQTASTQAGEPFNWGRDEVRANLQAMLDELPLPAPALDRLCDTVLSAEQHRARDIVSACVVADAAH
jgi:2-methylcitrate dehydratase PrpD